MNMKKVFLVLALAIGATVFAAENTNPFDGGTSKLISTEVFKLLEHPDFSIQKDLQAKVVIATNKDNEIVVLSVDSESDRFASYIKARLNYSKISGTQPNRTYGVPVRLVLK